MTDKKLYKEAVYIACPYCGHGIIDKCGEHMTDIDKDYCCGKCGTVFGYKREVKLYNTSSQNC